MVGVVIWKPGGKIFQDGMAKYVSGSREVKQDKDEMCPLDLEAGNFLMTLKVETTLWWAEKSVRGEEVKTGSGDNS